MQPRFVSCQNNFSCCKLLSCTSSTINSLIFGPFYCSCFIHFTASYSKSLKVIVFQRSFFSITASCRSCQTSSSTSDQFVFPLALLYHFVMSDSVRSKLFTSQIVWIPSASLYAQNTNGDGLHRVYKCWQFRNITYRISVKLWPQGYHWPKYWQSIVIDDFVKK